MKRLFVMRHAKSSWNHPGLTDFERPLNDRGLKAAPFMASYLAANGLSPQQIVSSPAMRARQTAMLVHENAGLTSGIVFDKRIYEAAYSDLIAAVSDIDNAVDSAMLVGHNPGLEELISGLTDQNVQMATACIVIIDLEIEKWGNVGKVLGDLITVLRPRELMDATS